MIKKIGLLMACWLLAMSWAAAQSITLEECYRLAKSNYPAIKKMDLIAKSSDYDIQNAHKGYLPQLNFSGQATYQSQTVSFADALGALPSGIILPSIDKDQYRVLGEVNQLVFDGGAIRNQKELIHVNRDLQEQQLKIILYAINSRINTIFFSVLLMDAQLKQNELNKQNLQTQLEKTEAALENGVAFRSNLDELRAELVNIAMAGTEYRFQRGAYLKMLSLFIGQEVDEVTRLVVPKTDVSRGAINRPELKAFDLQRAVVDVQRKDLNRGYLPQVNAFFQGAYGRPTLNIVENKFGPWYVTGLRFNWSLASLYTLSNRRNSLSLSQQSIEVDRETFLFNTNLDWVMQDEQVKKYRDLIKQDDEVIALRTAVTRSAEAQLENGVITTHEYIQKVNAEHLARQNKILHEVQLLQANYNQKFITGNSY